MFGRPTSRRSPWLRLSALASALALSLAWATDAYGLHRCDHHDALPGQAETAGSAHAAHGEHHAGAVETSDAEKGSGHEGGCTCVGDCSSADVAPAGDDAPSIGAPLQSTTASAAQSPSAAERIEWLLPPINGPPART